MAASETCMAVAGMHLHFPGFSRIEKAGTGFAVVPA